MGKTISDNQAHRIRNLKTKIFRVTEVKIPTSTYMANPN